jgi:Ferric reductase NAD binding domain
METMSGVAAAASFLVLGVSSLNWVRRRNYRVVYLLLTAVALIPYFLFFLIPSGGRVEVHLDAHETASAVLDREPCQFGKLCVPKISLDWHPFGVFQGRAPDGKADGTDRILIRPVGPFTKALAERLTSQVERPVTLVDGFYVGSDKAELAMQHDCVTIVAGGVALSPFLTLIPALLDRIARSERGGAVKTKPIVLHWVCREPGLCSFCVDKYLTALVERAGALQLDISLAVYVYLTGGGKAGADESQTCSNAVEEKRASSGPVPINAETGLSDGESPAAEDRESTVGVADAPPSGHPVELARMYPRRHTRAVRNLPLSFFFC